MYLSDEIQKQLRNMNIILMNEVIKKEGDLFLAINVETQQRRIVNIDNTLIESLQSGKSASVTENRRGLLKG